MAEERKEEQLDLFELQKPVIKGYPELRWAGKRPYTSTQFFPAQLKEKYGEADENGWMNKLFWGDNLQVMSHLLKEFRGKIDLIYIDPPFDSKADYKKTIKVRGKTIQNDNNTFEEKQYGDIWTNDAYLQFMYERLILLRELLSDTGSIFLHCDWHQSGHLRLILSEVFGEANLVNEIVWGYKDVGGGRNNNFYKRKHDTIFWFSKTENYKTNEIARAPLSQSTLDRFGSLFDENGVITYRKFKEMRPAEFETRRKQGRVPDDLDMVFLSKDFGRQMEDYWIDINPLRTRAEKDDPDEVLEYPTQKPVALLERIIKTATFEGDLVFDCFMGSGTTQIAALNLNRRFLGADINLGSIQIATKRLAKEVQGTSLLSGNKTGFEVFNVNNYDFFRNPVEARDLLIEALGIQPFGASNTFDGELDGRNVKILPVNRIATKADLSELVASLPYKAYEKRRDENPNEPVDRITLICMGHEPDLKAGFEQMIGTFKIDVEIVDILREKSALEFKREATAKIDLKHDELVIKEFYPMNLLQKLSIQKENVDEWRQLVDSIMIDYNYDGETLNPQIIDIPEKNDMVKGRYNIPKNHGKIKVKITDLLSESLEVEVK